MNKNSLLTRGFTLIELLVVIAIIGILAAVVLGSLNDARSGGQDASIKQSVANIRSQAELVYNSSGYSYDSVCADPRIEKLLDAAVKVVNGVNYNPVTHSNSDTYLGSNGVTNSARIAACMDSDTAYSAIAPLANDVGFWCVDSTGYSGSSTPLSSATDYTCNP